MFNVIDNLGVRAVDEDGVCKEVFVSIEDGCSVSVDGTMIESSYSARGVSVRRSVRGYTIIKSIHYHFYCASIVDAGMTITNLRVMCKNHLSFFLSSTLGEF